MSELARLVLAGVFAVAGAAKLADRDGARQGLRGFGVPDRLVASLALALPLTELVVSAALVPGSSARAAGAAALILLVLFSAAIVLAVRRGRKPDCHCFGRLRSAPAGWGTLARNGALAALALLVLWRPAADPSWTQLAAIGVGAVVVGHALLSRELLRRYGRALTRIEELEAGGTQRAALEVGAEAPAFALPTIRGDELTLRDLLAHGRPVLLVFADPDCGPCHALLPELATREGDYAGHLTLAVVSRGRPEDNAAVQAHGLGTVLLQESREVAQRYGVEATPSAVLVGADGRVAHAPVAGAGAIVELVQAKAPHVPAAREAVVAGRGRVVTAAGVAGGLAVTTAAHAAGRPASEQPSDPELQAIDAALKAAAPRLAAASNRSLAAVRAEATLRTGKKPRARRAAAVRALAAERREVLALRATLEKLPATGAAPHNVKVMTFMGLSLLAQSLRKRERALTAGPKRARRLVGESQRLFLEALSPLANAFKLLGSG